MREPAPAPAPDLTVPGWVEIAGEWRWVGAGAPAVVEEPVAPPRPEPSSMPD